MTKWALRMITWANRGYNSFFYCCRGTELKFLTSTFKPLRSVHTRQQFVATCHGDTLQWQIVLFCTVEFLWKSLQQNTSCTNSVLFEFLRLVTAKKLCCGDKDFHKNSQVHMKRFVAVTCRLTVLLQLVAQPVHMEWSVAATCCCNLSPSVYRP